MPQGRISTRRQPWQRAQPCQGDTCAPCAGLSLARRRFVFVVFKIKPNGIYAVPVVTSTDSTSDAGDSRGHRLNLETRDLYRAKKERQQTPEQNITMITTAEVQISLIVHLKLCIRPIILVMPVSPPHPCPCVEYRPEQNNRKFVCPWADAVVVRGLEKASRVVTRKTLIINTQNDLQYRPAHRRAEIGPSLTFLCWVEVEDNTFLCNVKD